MVSILVSLNIKYILRFYLFYFFPPFFFLNKLVNMYFDRECDIKRKYAYQ